MSNFSASWWSLLQQRSSSPPYLIKRFQESQQRPLTLLLIQVESPECCFANDRFWVASYQLTVNSVLMWKQIWSSYTKGLSLSCNCSARSVILGLILLGQKLVRDGRQQWSILTLFSLRFILFLKYASLPHHDNFFQVCRFSARNRCYELQIGCFSGC